MNLEHQSWSEIENLSQWEIHKDKLLIFIMEHFPKKDSFRIPILLHLMGDRGIEIYNTFEKDKVRNFYELIECFDNYFMHKHSNDKGQGKLKITATAKMVEDRIFQVTYCTDDKSRSYDSLVVGRRLPLKFLLDSEAEVSTLPLKYIEQLNKSQDILPTTTTLVKHGRFKIKPLGQITLPCLYLLNYNNINFLIMNNDCEPILCLKDYTNCKLKMYRCIRSTTKRQDLTYSYKNVFYGLGRFLTVESLHMITPTYDDTLKVIRQSKVPLTKIVKFKQTLDSMYSECIICPTSVPTNKMRLVNALLIEEKLDGTLSLCLDPEPLKKRICSLDFIKPRCGEEMIKLVDNNLFSVLALKDFQMVLDECVTDHFKFETPFGMYKFLRMPPGIAPEVFNRRIYQIFGNIPNVEIYFDDIIVFGKTEKEHDIALRKVFERCTMQNIKLDFDKFEYKIKGANLYGKSINAKKYFAQKSNKQQKENTKSNRDSDRIKPSKLVPRRENKTKILKTENLLKPKENGQNTDYPNMYPNKQQKENTKSNRDSDRIKPSKLVPRRENKTKILKTENLLKPKENGQNTNYPNMEGSLLLILMALTFVTVWKTAK